MKVIHHFDDCAIKISPSLLKNKLHSWEAEVKSLFKMGIFLTGFLSVLPSVVTVDNYKEKTLGVSGNMWGAVLIFALTTFFVLFVVEGFKLFIKLRSGKFVTVDKFVEELIQDKN